MGNGAEKPIQQVSDTAFWVATYRAIETARKDALFQDPLAQLLTDGKGREISAKMGNTSTMSWSIAIRTHIIDDYIRSAVQQGIDTVLNLGAGLDTRPYRMDLPPTLLWIEADFPHVFDFKEERLRNAEPRCQLERVCIDLSDAGSRQQLFDGVSTQGKRILVITEGVTPYLSIEDVAALAKDLSAQPSFELWITDYFSALFMELYRKGYLLKNLGDKAPFKFFPENWEEFFKSNGWSIKQMRYLTDEGARLNRPSPTPWYFKLLLRLMSKTKRTSLRQMNGYALLGRSS
jgi:methyltransferase (TIGR00027 family)